MLYNTYDTLRLLNWRSLLKATVDFTTSVDSPVDFSSSCSGPFHHPSRFVSPTFVPLSFFFFQIRFSFLIFRARVGDWGAGRRKI